MGRRKVPFSLTTSHTAKRGVSELILSEDSGKGTSIVDLSPALGLGRANHLVNKSNRSRESIKVGKSWGERVCPRGLASNAIQ